MTLAQIMALLSLLMAFGVDQPTINRVETILRAPQSVTIKVMENEPVFEAKPAAEGVQVEPKQSKYSKENVPVATDYTASPNQQ